MNEFTASNGVKIRESLGGTITFKGSGHEDFRKIYVYQVGSDLDRAMSEYYQDRRDQELGRWRWPEHPEYVVYSRGVAGICVASEKSGQMMLVAHRDRVEDWDSGEATFFGAARAYYEAHPEPKPWESAKPGEVWRIETTEHCGRYAAIKQGNGVGGQKTYLVPMESLMQPKLGLAAPIIISGRRLFPEPDDA